VRDPLPAAGRRPGLTVIGVGNRWRHDDGAGIEVARRLAAEPSEGVRVVIHDRGDVSSLADDWRTGEAAVVVDAASSGGGAGVIHRFDSTVSPLPAHASRTSSHAFGVAEAVELARAIDRMPRSLVVYAIEGSCFDVGVGLTPEVERAVERLVAELRSGGVPHATP
jgi:hydrogenase maturation protease